MRRKDDKQATEDTTRAGAGGDEGAAAAAEAAAAAAAAVKRPEPRPRGRHRRRHAPRPGAPKPKNGKGGNAAPVPFHRQDGFKDRLGREAEALVRKTLGVSIEEAKAIVAARAAAPGPAAAVPGAPAAAPSRRDPDEKLRRENQDLANRVQKQSDRIKKLKTKNADERINMQMRGDALGVGIMEEHVDFALNLLAGAIRTALGKSEAPPDSRTFFAGLRKARAYLFREGTKEVTLRASTAPPESTAPGGETPTQDGPATPPKKVDAMEMSDEQFRAAQGQDVASPVSSSRSLSRLALLTAGRRLGDSSGVPRTKPLNEVHDDGQLS